MATVRSVAIICTLCGAALPRNKIKCTVCRHTNFGAPRSLDGDRVDDGIKRLSEVKTVELERIKTGFADRNWGPKGQEGICVTSVTLLGGAPGAGKSTLSAQLLSAIAVATKGPTLYVGAEESGEQVKDRAVRLKLPNLEDLLILALEDQAAGHRLTQETFDRWKPRAVVIDSAQKYSDSPEAAVQLCEQVKETAVLRRCPFFVISQVNKEEEFAGLNAFQHAADTLISFTLAEVLVSRSGRELFPPRDPDNPEKIEPFRVLKTSKNRFGDAWETYFTMHADGLHPFFIPEGVSEARAPRREEAEEPEEENGTEDADDADDDNDEER